MAHSLSDSWLIVGCLGSSVTRCISVGNGNSLAGDGVDGIGVEGVVGMVPEDNGNVLRASWLLDVPSAVAGDGGDTNTSLTSELLPPQSGYSSFASLSVAPSTAFSD